MTPSTGRGSALREGGEGEYGVVVGNCQAESLRIVLDSPDLRLIRVPPVHEMDAADAAALHELLAGAAALVTQPVRDDYHGLPVGTAQLRRALPQAAAMVTFPVLRFTGLHPFQAVLHVEGVEEAPPVVAYHDVRTLAEAAGLTVASRLRPDAVRAVAADSLDELRRREQDIDVAASDLFEPARFSSMRTVNHPGNEIFLALGERVLRALGRSGSPTDPGRPLLSAVRAPREEWVIEAWGSGVAPHRDWLVGGERVGVDEVAAAHREWYSRHPAFVDAALTRLAPLLTRWTAG